MPWTSDTPRREGSPPVGSAPSPPPRRGCRTGTEALLLVRGLLSPMPPIRRSTAPGCLRGQKPKGSRVLRDSPRSVHTSTTTLVGHRRISRHRRRRIHRTHRRAVAAHHRRGFGSSRRLFRLLAATHRDERENQRHKRQSKKLTHRVHVHLLSRYCSRRQPETAVFFLNVRIECPEKNTTVQKAVSGRQRPCAYAVVSAARG